MDTSNKTTLREAEKIAHKIINKYCASQFKKDPDLLCDTITAILKADSEFDPTKKSKSLYSYRVRLAKYAILNYLKKNKKWLLFSSDLSTVREMSNYTENDFIWDDIYKILSKEKAYIIERIYRFSCTTYEVAEELNFSQAYVHKVLTKSLQELRERYV